MEAVGGVDGIERKKIVRGLRRFTFSAGDGRRLLKGHDNKVALELGASKDLLEARACPDGLSPKRPTQMEVDSLTPSKKKKKTRSKRMLEEKVDTTQRLMTDLWRKGKQHNEGN